MISHVPLRPDLGAGRVQLELSREFRRMGHEVSTFDYVDAFGSGHHPRLDRLRSLIFAYRARDYVRKNSRRFDVLDAQQGCLPFSKKQLGFGGLVVTRSCGLYAFYQQYDSFERTTWPDRLPGTVLGKGFASWATARHFRACRRSLQTCDLINLLNNEERAYVREHLALGDRCVVIPNGVTDEHALSLQRALQQPHERLKRKEVTFVGHWSLRKGAADWPKIVALASQIMPDLRFSFLGVGVAPETILRDLTPEQRSRVRVVPSFVPSELPTLISGSAVGALPSYIEGWPLGLLEQLSAGIPTVAYGSPGPREMMGDLARELIVPAGDVAAFSRRLAEIMSMATDDYAMLARQCSQAVRGFRWKVIAESTLSSYSRALGRSVVPDERIAAVEGRRMSPSSND